MALSRISLSHFRNHRETQIDGARQFNLLVGENGAGKTNVLEAISLLAPGRGLRRAALADMASRFGSAPEPSPRIPASGWSRSTARHRPPTGWRSGSRSAG
jgi:predicted ATP-dependent endonuclease of OLD family